MFTVTALPSFHSWLTCRDLALPFVFTPLYLVVTTLDRNTPTEVTSYVMAPAENRLLIEREGLPTKPGDPSSWLIHLLAAGRTRWRRPMSLVNEHFFFMSWLQNFTLLNLTAISTQRLPTLPALQYTPSARVPLFIFFPFHLHRGWKRSRFEVSQWLKSAS